MPAILIAGSRRKWWPNPEEVAEFVDGMLDGFDSEEDVLINGCADGVDEWTADAALCDQFREGVAVVVDGEAVIDVCRDCRGAG